VVRIVPYQAFELSGTARVPSSHWLNISRTKGQPWDRSRQIPIQTRLSGEDTGRDHSENEEACQYRLYTIIYSVHSIFHLIWLVGTGCHDDRR
jgi:hypothetical protein